MAMKDDISLTEQQGATRDSMKDVDGGDGEPMDTAAYTGDLGEFASIYEPGGYNAVKDLLDFTGDLDNVLAKGNFTPERANLMRRMLMRAMVDQTGTLDRVQLVKLEAIISAATEGSRIKQVVQVLTGMGMGAAEAARNGWDRIRGRVDNQGKRF